MVKASHGKMKEKRREPRGVSIVRKLSNNAARFQLPRRCSLEKTMSKVPALTSDNFASSVENAQGVVVVDFTATWCPPCKMLAPVLDRVSEKYEGRAKFFKVDVDENPETAGKYGVSTIPNLLFFKDGQVVDQSVGYVAEGALSGKVDNVLA